MKPTRSLRGFPESPSLKPEEWDLYFDRQGEKWTDEEIDYLTSWYARLSVLEMSYALGRSPKSVISKAEKLGIQTPGRGKHDHGWRKYL